MPITTNGHELPSQAPDVELYTTMSRIRAFELAAEKLFLAGELPGFIHVSIGQEAVAAGVCAALSTEDYLTTTHRGHGHTLAKGADTTSMMAELFGRTTGVCAGRGGSMHIADFSVGMLGANAIVAGGIGIAVGAALTAAMTGNGHVAATFFGDGATGRGPFAESLNLAQLWQLPVVLVCENNGWASTTRNDEALAQPDISRRARALGMNAIDVDGNNVFDVHAAAREAVGRARAGAGPTLIQAHVHRWRGHYVGDPAKYYDPAEVARWKAKDPLERAAMILTEHGTWRPGEREQIDSEAAAEIEGAVASARNAPEPDPASVARFLFHEPPGLPQQACAPSPAPSQIAGAS
ncbi:thiamine pyrophosphate-dependent dehydrogenase E1 component subunit alpha [Pseudonocardia sp. EC080625-04]|uniref:thiamine pyrophosphate-dependent dehydrogenase E1 component subunit alpha n=1 Tax=Pseudonocardia sp. EC080625-04 TaxID=1096868 RepID=UPI000761DFC0|nr:thiamine pyrophosphate-dependent dehydrogenase E1 component subunit alpha [Pseudonocardia sp. EC080625-04]